MVHPGDVALSNRTRFGVKAGSQTPSLKLSWLRLIDTLDTLQALLS